MGVARIRLLCAITLMVAVSAPSYAAARSEDAPAQATRDGHAVAATAHALQGHRVRISGRTAAGSRVVSIQRAGHLRWRTVATAHVRQHHFRRVLLQPGDAATYRVTTPGARSATLHVQLASPTAKPSTIKPSTRPATDACGVRPAKADGSLWSCTFDDEFGGTALDRTKWIPQTIFTTGNPDALACYRDDPRNVSVANGTLNLTVRKESAPQPCAALPGQTSAYTAGMVSTYHLFSQQYGRFEARIKSPTYSGPGLQDDFWLWPDDRYPSTDVWPAAGEIDVNEHYSSYAGLDVPFLHYAADAQGSQPGVNTAYTCSIKPGAFNTYTLTWSASRLEIDVNGAPCLINTSGDPAFQKPYIVALTQALGVGANGLDANTPLPATMQVDYVRVWS